MQKLLLRIRILGYKLLQPLVILASLLHNTTNDLVNDVNVPILISRSEGLVKLVQLQQEGNLLDHRLLVLQQRDGDLLLASLLGYLGDSGVVDGGDVAALDEDLVTKGFHLLDDFFLDGEVVFDAFAQHQDGPFFVAQVDDLLLHIESFCL